MRRLPLLLAVLTMWNAPAWAAISVVQCTSLVDTDATGHTSQNTANFGVNPTVGNYIIVSTSLVQIGGSGTGVTSVVDTVSGSNVYSIDVQRTRSDAQVFTSIASAKVAVTGAGFQVSIHFNNTGTAMAAVFMACEVSGLAASSVLDKTANSEINSGTSLTVTGPSQNSQQSEIVFTGFATSTFSGTPTTGYTSLWNSATNVNSQAADKIISACETSSASTSFTSADVMGVIATYKGSSVVSCSGGGGSTGVPLTTLHVGH